MIFNTYKFSNYDNNKFNLLLQKGVYPYEYMHNWEKFNKATLPEKNHLNIEDITDEDYVHAGSVSKYFEINFFE